MALSDTSHTSHDAFHDRTCASLAAIVRDGHDALAPRRHFLSPRRKLARTQVLEELRSLSLPLPLPNTMLVHVFSVLDDAHAESEYLASLSLDARQLLAPHYIERLGTLGLRVRRLTPLSAEIRLHESSVSVHALVNAYEARKRTRVVDGAVATDAVATSVRMSTIDALDVHSVLVSAAQVRGLDASSQHLTSMPRALWHVFAASLSVLRLEHNELEHVPVEAGALHGLRVLSLANNRLTSIDGHAIRGWHSLRRLNVARNRLRTLDEEAYASLEHLESLDAGGNVLEHFPRGLQRCPSLGYLSLMHNRPHFERNEFGPIDLAGDGVLVARRLQCFL